VDTTISGRVPSPFLAVAGAAPFVCASNAPPKTIVTNNKEIRAFMKNSCPQAYRQRARWQLYLCLFDDGRSFQSTEKDSIFTARRSGGGRIAPGESCCDPAFSHA
jgi:hypothetical protein